MILNWVEGQRL